MFLISGSKKTRREGRGGGRGLWAPVSSFHHRGQSSHSSLQTLTFLFLRISFYFTVWTKMSPNSLINFEYDSGEDSRQTLEKFDFKSNWFKSLPICTFISQQIISTNTTTRCFDKIQNKHSAWISPQAEIFDVFIVLLWGFNSFYPDYRRIYSGALPLC